MGSEAYLGSGVLPVGKSLKWSAEFASPYDPTGGQFGTPETPFVHDFTLTYLLPAPIQLERRVVDF